MLDLRRALKTFADELAPFLKIRRAAKVDGVIFERFPFDEQPVAARFLDRAQELHALAPLGAAEQGCRLGDAGLELSLRALLHVDLRNFKNHSLSFPFFEHASFSSSSTNFRSLPLKRGGSGWGSPSAW